MDHSIPVLLAQTVNKVRVCENIGGQQSLNLRVIWSRERSVVLLLGKTTPLRPLLMFRTVVWNVSRLCSRTHSVAFKRIKLSNGVDSLFSSLTVTVVVHIVKSVEEVITLVVLQVWLGHNSVSHWNVSVVHRHVPNVSTQVVHVHIFLKSLDKCKHFLFKQIRLNLLHVIFSAKLIEFVRVSEVQGVLAFLKLWFKSGVLRYFDIPLTLDANEFSQFALSVHFCLIFINSSMFMD